MAHPASIDPVHPPALTRTNVARGKRTEAFAKALGDQLDRPKASDDARPNTEHTRPVENHEPNKSPREPAASRKAADVRHRANETRSSTTPQLTTAEITEQDSSSPQNAEPAKAQAADEEHIVNAPASECGEDQCNQKDNKIEAEKIEVASQEQIVCPNPNEDFTPPAQPPTLQEFNSTKDKPDLREDAPNIKISSNATSEQSSAAISSHAASLTQSEPTKEEKKIADTKSVHHSDEKDGSTEEPKQDFKSHLSDISDREKPTTEAHLPHPNVEHGTQISTSSGSIHGFHHLVSEPTPLSSVPNQTLPDPTKAAPIPVHALPIEIGLRALDGTKEITLDLAPKELGQLNIRISVDDQSAIQVSIVTEKPQTLALLQNDASHIRHALEQAGYATQDSSLQFSLQNNLSSNSNSSQGDQRKSRARRASDTDFKSAEIETHHPIRQRLHLNQLDLSV